MTVMSRFYVYMKISRKEFALLLEIVCFIVKIHLIYKAFYKTALSRRSQCMYTIYNWKKIRQEIHAGNVSYSSETLMAGLVEVQHKSSLESLLKTVLVTHSRFKTIAERRFKINIFLYNMKRKKKDRKYLYLKLFCCQRAGNLPTSMKI